MITVRFENTAEEFQGDAADFLESLGLDPERWREEQRVGFGTRLREPANEARVLGIVVPIPDDLLQAEAWVCSIQQDGGAKRFFVSGREWAAALEDPEDLGSALQTLPHGIEALSLVGCGGLAGLERVSRWGCLRTLQIREPTRDLEDLGPLSGLGQLRRLDLSQFRFATVSALNPLAGLDHLTHLRLRWFPLLKNLQPLSCLKRLENLELWRCEALRDLVPLAGLGLLTRLSLGSSRVLRDVGPLSALVGLKDLDLGWSAIEDVRPLSALTRLKRLSLHACESLKDLSGLAALYRLEVLDLGGCEQLCDLGPLSELARLTALHLHDVGALRDLRPLSRLEGLEHLDLSYNRHLRDISPLAALRRLKDLNLSWCESLGDLGSLSGLKRLTSLSLHGCRSLTDIRPLTGLSGLTRLELTRCDSLADLSPLFGMAHLGDVRELDLSNCSSLSDLRPLSALPNLERLSLGACVSLADLGPLSGLTQLTHLNLQGCRSVLDLGPLGCLRQLATLDLSGCESLADVGPLSASDALVELRLGGCRRLRSLEPLRGIASLRIIEVDFHPSVVAELLAHAAAVRRDGLHIAQHSEQWLLEASGFDDGTPAEQEGLATTLGTAFSLLGENPIEAPYEGYLRANPGFSGAPWKAWFLGTREHSGFGLLQERVGRQEIENSSVGCLGGICGALPDDTSSVEEQVWARDWLARLEAAWGARGRELLPVGAEVCLAHARLGMAEALDRWLARFTDPSDLAGLDPVHAALGAWQLGRGEVEAASRHAMAMERPEARDGLLARIIEACVGTDAERAGRLLLLVENAELAGNLAVRLAGEASFVVSAMNVERLLVACGGSVESLSSLINRLGPAAAPSHLEALSQRLRTGAQSDRTMEQARLLRLVAESLREGGWRFRLLLSQDDRARLVRYLSLSDLP